MLKYSNQQVRRLGGVLIFLGGLGFLFSGVKQLLRFFFLYLTTPWIEPSNPVTVYLKFARPFVFPLLGLIASIAAVKAVSNRSIHMYWLVGTLITAFWGVIDGIFLEIYNWTYEPIYIFRLDLMYFLIIILLLQCCPMILGTYLVYRNN
ncbi:MAG TPA: hypothetical protein VMV49_17270 [Candidatus Deferrimicrobium sp.]|nr:hypothetical protein [Candidatus Deferrimicrobium sp.]